MVGRLGLHCVLPAVTWLMLLGDLSVPCPSELGRFWWRSNYTSKKCGSLGVGAWEEAHCEGNDHSRRRLWKERPCP